MRKVAFFVLSFTSTLFAQTTKPQPLGVGNEALYETTAEFKANNPNCFLPTESLPANYKAAVRSGDEREKTFDCRITSVGTDEFRLLGLPVRARSTVLVNDRVAAIFYDFRRKNFRAIEKVVRMHLGKPTEEKPDGYIGHDGCKGREIHWANAVSDIVLVDECGEGKTTLNMFYTDSSDLTPIDHLNNR